MNFNMFNNGIKNIIDILSYDFYIVTANKKLDCKCLDKGSGQPDKNCLHCLGIGYKIKIKKISGYQNDEKITIRNSNNTENVSSTIYYIDNKYKLNNERIIVDRDEVYMVNRVERYKSSDGNIIYKKYFCTPKKDYPQLFLKNFYNIVKK